MNEWLIKKLNVMIDQVDEDFDIPVDLNICCWLLEIINDNKIELTEKQWHDYQLRFGDEVDWDEVDCDMSEGVN